MKDSKSVTILGATGSVGCNTAALILENPSAYSVEALTAWRNVDELARLAVALRPRFVAIGDPDCYADLKAALANSGIEIAAGSAAIIEAARRPADWVMAAIVGTAGLEPTMAAIGRGATVALANKECLVSAGAVMMQAVARSGATLLPVDSEHNAVFQVFDHAHRASVERIILTASGGPFHECSLAEMAQKTPAEAVAHPNWRMGAKISVDSASMMNKGLEVIEAHHLFGLEESRIEVLVNPQSIIHSLVCYIDGSVLAQLGTPDMRIPIAHTLAWPERIATTADRLDLAQVTTLTFCRPDTQRFPALALGRAALRAADGSAAVLSAANEIAVGAFLEGRIGFTRIAETVEAVLAAIPAPSPQALAAVLELDSEARRCARSMIYGEKSTAAIAVAAGTL